MALFQISDIFEHKYGKKYADSCRVDSLGNVNDKVKRRMGTEAPPKLLVEQYLIEIAKNFNVSYVPDPQTFHMVVCLTTFLKFSYSWCSD